MSKKIRHTERQQTDVDEKAAATKETSPEETIELEGGDEKAAATKETSPEETIELEGGDVELEDEDEDDDEEKNEDPAAEDNAPEVDDGSDKAELLPLPAITKVRTSPLEQLAFMMAEVVEGADVAKFRQLVADSVPRDMDEATIFVDRVKRLKEACELAFNIAYTTRAHNASL